MKLKLTFFFTVCFSINRERSSHAVLAECQHLKISDIRVATDVVLFPRSFMNLEKFVHKSLKCQHKEHASRNKTLNTCVQDAFLLFYICLTVHR